MSATNFDNALDAFVVIVRAHLPEFGVNDAVLRDIYGRLTLFLRDPVSEETRAALAERLATLVPYVRRERLIVVAGEPGADDVLGDPNAQWVQVGGTGPSVADYVRIIDRRIVGNDWLARPSPPPADAGRRPRRFVFASLKGGVGRTTALCVAATELAAAGYNVLVVDLDLEAPGVGPMLWADCPPHGVVDLLAAAALGVAIPVSDAIVGSRFNGSEGGAIDVLAAYGQSSVDKPENYLAKLARAVADVSLGDAQPVHARIAQIIDVASAARSYDVILIDARAGLSEITAGPLLRLDAHVLLFGTAQHQTFEDYRFLFAHLKSLGRPGEGTPWTNLTPVLAKAGNDGRQLVRAQADMYELFATYIYEEADATSEAYNFDESAPDAPHRFVPIAFESTFATFDPVMSGSHLTEQFYRATFAPFLDALWLLADLTDRKFQ